MFNEINNQPGANKAVDDIFAETENNAAPSAPGSANIEAQPAGLSAQSFDDNGTGEKHQSKIKFILILILSALILGAAGYLVYSKFMRPTEEVASINDNNYQEPEAPVVSSEEPAATDSGVVVPVSETDESAATTTEANTATETPLASSTTTVETPVATAPVDSDGDSLTDIEEQALGTSANLIDTDFDGLSDYEEVQVYSTNPLNPDSDGDTFTDGDEIKNGYNPKGDGKLQ